MIIMDIKDIARKSLETVREYMREQARDINARNRIVNYGYTVFDDVESIDAYVYQYGDDSLRAFIVLSDSYGDVLDIRSDIVRVGNICPVVAEGTGYWAQQFVKEYFADMWCSARIIIEERERVKRLEGIRADVEHRATVDF